MEELILVRYGEIALKGGNRSLFIRQLIKNIGKALQGIDHSIIKDRGRIFIKPGTGPEDTDRAMERLKRVFGIVSLSRVIMVEKDLDTVKRNALEMVRKHSPGSFKVESRRADKSFPVESPEICRQVGGYILKNSEGVKVDVHRPDLIINIEIRDKAYIFAGMEKGSGGLPTGTGERSAVSGGIDSPVAGWMVAKGEWNWRRFTFTAFLYQREGEAKVIDLAEVLAGYTGGLNLHMVSLTDIQSEYKHELPCRAEHDIDAAFYDENRRKDCREVSPCPCDGESLGQVASQTMESIYVTDSCVNLPVFRPLVGMDKTEIIERARNIGTYELSILPYEDCCTFCHSIRDKARLERIMQSESHLEIQRLVDKAVETRETLEV